jgi:Carbohydrate-selective porin, OprB family/S-layer homology domain
MNRRFRTLWLVKSATISLLLAGIPLGANAAEPTDNLSVAPGTRSMPSLISDVNETEQSAEQVTSVSQLSDVQPTDWAFQSLQSLVERYGCIAGYPDGTFRGNRAATRYEIAAALNACLDQISDRFAIKEDLEVVKALQEEFKAELATLKGRVDSLEAHAATLEAQQFSTTTKLVGEAIFGISEVFSYDDDKAVPTGSSNAALNARPIFSDRLRLNFDTSFTGKDRLRVRLQARNFASNADASGTNMTRLIFDGDNQNTFELDDLNYRFPIGKNARLTVLANSGDFYSFVGDNFNPYLSSDASGGLSRFSRFNPIYRFSDGGSGAVFNYKFNNVFAASVGYLADRPTNSVGPTGGLFGGSYSALAQLEVKPLKNLGLGLTYVHAFQEAGAPNNILNLTGSTGSAASRRPFGNNVPMSSDSAGFEFNWKVAKWMNISGWAGITFAESAIDSRDATVLNWAAAFAFPDLFKEGNLGAVIIGQQPRIVGGGVSNCGSSGSANNTVADCDANFHVEALYKYKVNGNISITPGIIVNFNPENNEGNGTTFTPVVRTTFTF